MWKVIYYQIRYSLPRWFMLLATNWMPDNRYTIKLRGWLVSFFIYHCGRNFQLARNVTILNGYNIRIGNDVYFATGCWLDGIGGLVIEDEVMLSPYVVVTTSSHCFKDGSGRFGGSRTGPVRIGRGSWLASHVAVAAGCTVGAGSIVGANAVVSKDVPDNVFAGGVPARVIGPRVDHEPTVFTRKDALAAKKEKEENG